MCISTELLFRQQVLQVSTELQDGRRRYLKARAGNHREISFCGRKDLHIPMGSQYVASLMMIEANSTDGYQIMSGL